MKNGFAIYHVHLNWKMRPLISVNLEATMDDQVVLLDLWASTYAMRVRIALAEKGVKFESKEENLFDKSKLLLEMNPVHKKVPVLIHNGRPICESLIILQYIDEVWNHQPALLPSDPHQRSQARFWADYIDKKVESVGRKIWLRKGEVQEEGKKELMEGLKTLEEELGEKPFFGGERLGFVDVTLLPLTSWFYSYETCGNFSIEAGCPNIIAWAKRCKQNDSICQTLPDPQSINDYVLQMKKQFGVE